MPWYHPSQLSQNWAYIYKLKKKSLILVESFPNGYLSRAKLFITIMLTGGNKLSTGTSLITFQILLLVFFIPHEFPIPPWRFYFFCPLKYWCLCKIYAVFYRDQTFTVLHLNANSLCLKCSFTLFWLLPPSLPPKPSMTGLLSWAPLLLDPSRSGVPNYMTMNYLKAAQEWYPIQRCASKSVPGWKWYTK